MDFDIIIKIFCDDELICTWLPDIDNWEPVVDVLVSNFAYFSGHNLADYRHEVELR